MESIHVMKRDELFDCPLLLLQLGSFFNSVSSLMALYPANKKQQL
jgi:hypothetical protein